jgi:hypothetical protein
LPFPSLAVNYGPELDAVIQASAPVQYDGTLSWYIDRRLIESEKLLRQTIFKMDNYVDGAMRKRSVAAVAPAPVLQNRSMEGHEVQEPKREKRSLVKRSQEPYLGEVSFVPSFVSLTLS